MIFRNVCPKCRTGQVFTGLIKMNPQCPHCGFVFEREQGYFLGAMSYSYVLGFFSILPLFLFMLSKEYSIATTVALPGIQLVLMAPFLFRYSRLIWMHMDYKMTQRSSEHE